MRFGIGCTATVVAVLLFDSVSGGALKNSFCKKEPSKNVSIGEESREQGADKEAFSQETERVAVKSPESNVNQTPKENSSDTSSNTSSNETSTSQPSASVTTSNDKKKIVGDPVVLRINGKKEFRRSQILADMKMIPPQMIQGVSPDKLFEMLRDQRSNAYLMIEQAKRAGMDRTKEFIEQVERAKEELLGRMFIIKELAAKAENESALKARYTKYLVEFKKEKEFKVFHIMLDNEKDAKEVLVSLGKSEDFSKLAQEKSLAPSKSKGGEEGYIPVSMMPPELKDKLISLKAGDYTKDYLKTEKGFHIFKVGDIRETSPQKFEEAVNMLKQLIMHEEMMKLIGRLEKQSKIEKFNEDGTPVAPKETAGPVSSETTPQ
ncbi:MAG: peptidylprolyl isomerase [Holosporaceae bacterium]|jgi:peptidyl-prolyl cis-trans isomerase C|nr:peptidylprolyl isomerase [Holosporaceae bacterium]